MGIDKMSIVTSLTKATQRMRYIESTPSIFVEALGLVDNTLGFSDELGLIRCEKEIASVTCCFLSLELRAIAFV